LSAGGNIVVFAIFLETIKLIILLFIFRLSRTNTIFYIRYAYIVHESFVWFSCRNIHRGLSTVCKYAWEENNLISTCNNFITYALSTYLRVIVLPHALFAGRNPRAKFRLMSKFTKVRHLPPLVGSIDTQPYRRATNTCARAHSCFAHSPSTTLAIRAWNFLGYRAPESDTCCWFFLQMFHRDVALEYIVHSEAMPFRDVQPIKVQIGGRDPNIASFLQKPTIWDKPVKETSKTIIRCVSKRVFVQWHWNEMIKVSLRLADAFLGLNFRSIARWSRRMIYLGVAPVCMHPIIKHQLLRRTFPIRSR